MSLDTLLIEIGTEELPPHSLEKFSTGFSNSIFQALSDLGLSCGKVEHFVTPRRIAARLFEVPALQAGRKLQKRGPALSAAFDSSGKPTPAAIGFARGCQVDVSSLKIHETPQGAWVVHEYEESAKSLEDLLPAIITQALNDIPAPKKMRWGNGNELFLRPIHWIFVMHGAKALPLNVFNLTASNVTYGHRFHHPEPLIIDHPDNYLILLRKAKVIASQSERQAFIRNAVTTLAEKNGGFAVMDEDLLKEVTGLVEWPVPFYAHFDRNFLEVPPEALISSMQNHQKCFAIKHHSGALLPTFIVISNTQAKSLENIIQGNERVMHARLADAKFFYDKDRKTPLKSRLEGLKNMLFQKKLGSLYDKSMRIARLAGIISKKIGAPTELAQQAGKLCKADLLTDMVFEFPELQGIMGSYYARQEGEPEEVVTAMRESYLPRFAKDKLPDSLTGQCLALADRIDSLMGIFGMGQIPTGDKDPFALRRQALAVLRILIEKQHPLSLIELLEAARHGYGNLFDEDVTAHVLEFCFDRFRAWYQEQGVSVQTLDAVMALSPTEPYDCSLRVLAVTHFQTLPQAVNLAAANKRVRNILQKNGINFSLQHLPEVHVHLLKEPAEKALFDAIDALKLQTAPLLIKGQYQEALILLAALQKPADQFFDEVLVMAEEENIRKNRIHLLIHLYALFMQIADIAKLAL